MFKTITVSEFLLHQSRRTSGFYPSVYQHIRNQQYYWALSNDIVLTEETVPQHHVLYQALYGQHELFLRPKDMFYQPTRFRYIELENLKDVPKGNPFIKLDNIRHTETNRFYYYNLYTNLFKSR